MTRVGTAGDAHRRPVTRISFMELARAVSTSFNADARVLDVSITLALDASYWDANVLAHIYQVIVNLNAAC